MAKTPSSSMLSESQLNAAAAVVESPYGKPRFIIPAKRSVSDRFGRISTKMLDAHVPLKGLGLSLICAIYCNIERKGDAVSVVPSAYIPSKFVSVDVEGASDAIAAHIENACIAWDGYDAAYSATAALLLGHTEPDAVDAVSLPKATRPVMARLVGKDGKLVATAAVSPQNAPAAPNGGN